MIILGYLCFLSSLCRDSVRNVCLYVTMITKINDSKNFLPIIPLHRSRYGRTMHICVDSPISKSYIKIVRYL
jgi:hypothetical protein